MRLIRLRFGLRWALANSAMPWDSFEPSELDIVIAWSGFVKRTLQDVVCTCLMVTTGATAQEEKRPSFEVASIRVSVLGAHESQINPGQAEECA